MSIKQNEINYPILNFSKFSTKFIFINLTLIFTFAFFLFSNTINHDYALDDTGAIQQNVNVKKGIKGIPDILKMDLWEQSEVR